jgi:hypothetical protein
MKKKQIQIELRKKRISINKKWKMMRKIEIRIKLVKTKVK